MKKLLTILLMSVMFVALGADESKAASAHITNMYLQHNQFHNGNKGMFVRYDFNVTGQMGRNVKAEVTLYKSNGKKIYFQNGSLVRFTLSCTPGYETTFYNGSWAFFPYATMNLPYGRTDCYAMVKIYSSGGKVLASRKENFWITR